MKPENLNRYRKPEVSDPLSGSFDFSRASAKEFFMNEDALPEDNNPGVQQLIKSLEPINFKETLLQNKAINFVGGIIARRYNMMPIRFMGGGNNALAIAVAGELGVSEVLDTLSGLLGVLKHPIAVKYKASSQHIRETIEWYYGVPDIDQPSILARDSKPKLIK